MGRRRCVAAITQHERKYLAHKTNDQMNFNNGSIMINCDQAMEKKERKIMDNLWAIGLEWGYRKVLGPCAYYFVFVSFKNWKFFRRPTNDDLWHFAHLASSNFREYRVHKKKTFIRVSNFTKRTDSPSHMAIIMICGFPQIRMFR